ncbi:MAG: MFS transporter [Gemmatimonadota bacterium]
MTGFRPSPSSQRRKVPETDHGRFLGGIIYQHPMAFWVGTVAVTVGVLLHLPDYLASATMSYRMTGMGMSTMMNVGMGLILVGLALAAYGLIPWRTGDSRPSEQRLANFHLHAMDTARLSPAHWGLLFVLGVALIVDVMKPATLGFVVPGMKSEYHLTTKMVVAVPIAGLLGTTIGSFLWGIVSDRIGRRAAILLASIMFVGTSICGFMPSYAWNLLMCFVMGLAAGGMLPIVYALMAESIPARKRGWLVVLHAGMGTVGGYLAASGLTALLEPHFTWRILWFAGLPTGLLLLVLNRWIPESPRFLLEHGRVEEAEAVMSRYGVVLEKRPEVVGGLPIGSRSSGPAPAKKTGVFQLFRAPYVGQTITVVSYGLAWGLVNWGFITFIPVILQDRGVDVGTASRLLFMSAFLAIPGTVLVAYLYGLWSSKKSMILFALVTAAALAGFAVVNPGASGEEGRWLTPLMVLLLVGSGGVIAMLSPYTAEVYPTAVRGTGSGLAAGSSKFGGIFGPTITAAVIVAAPGFTTLAAVMIMPLLVSSGLLAFIGKETKDRALEEVSVSDPQPVEELPS